MSEIRIQNCFQQKQQNSDVIDRPFYCNSKDLYGKLEKRKYLKKKKQTLKEKKKEKRNRINKYYMKRIYEY